MSDFPSTEFDREAGIISSAGSRTLLADPLIHNRSSFASSVWPATNRACYLAFWLNETVTAYKIGWENGTVASGNLDAGIFDEFGAKLASTGATAQTGTSVIQVADITDTLLPPGNYFMGMSMDNATGTHVRYGPGGSPWGYMSGFQQEATAYPLPATATFASIAPSMPNMCIYVRAAG